MSTSSNTCIKNTNDDDNTNAKKSANKCARMDRICDNILDCIGDTPMIRLNRVGSDIGCEFLVKCEFFNAGGSVKDRIGKQMILDAESSHKIKPNQTILIEPTSGNTGIGIALASAIKGYRCIITMPEKMSKEKVDILKALGAEIVRTPTEAAYDAPDSHISVARRLCDDTEHGYILDQYTNPSNPAAHYNGTAEEIIRQCSSNGSENNKIDMLVAGCGTGGTITGIAKRLKEVYPNIIVVGCDPVGSILALPETLNNEHRLESYQVEGIGYDFIPDVLDRSTTVIDKWIKTNDHESLVMMRRLIRDEGLLCGGSSGAAVCAALRAAKYYKLNQKHHRIVIILPDSVRNYMTKALSDDWMSDHGFVDGDVIKAKSSYGQTWWSSKKVYELPINTPLTITSNVRCKDAIALLKKEGFDMVPVLDDNAGGHIIGVVTEGNITKCILSGRCNPDTPIADSGVIYKTFHKFTMNSTLGALANALDHDPFVLIVTEQRCFSFEKPNKKRRVSNNNNYTATKSSTDSIASLETLGTPLEEEEDDQVTINNDNVNNLSKGEAKMMTRSVVSGIVSRIDLLDFIASSSHRDV